MQALNYAVHSNSLVSVTNLKETRLYYKGQDTVHYEKFETSRLPTTTTNTAGSCSS